MGKINIQKVVEINKKAVFSVNNSFIKQIDGCLMGGPTSVVFLYIYVLKMEEDVVTQMKAQLCKRYIDDTYIWKK